MPYVYGVNEKMDDKLFLRDFKLTPGFTKKSESTLKFLPAGSEGTRDCTIFIFTHSENARIFFLDPNRKSVLGRRNIFVLENEDAVPASVFEPDDRVFLLSIKYGCEVEMEDTMAPLWAPDLFVVLGRVFIYELWDLLKQSGFNLPKIVTDDDYAVRMVKLFIDTQLKKYRDLLGLINRLKAQATREGKGQNILIYNVEDPKLEALNYALRRKQQNSFIVDNRLGWKPDEGWKPEDNRFMVDEDFARFLIEKNIQYVIFENNYDIDLLKNDGVSKIWIMRELGIRGISIVVDTVIECADIRFKFMHWLPDNIQVINLSVTESYDALSKWMCAERVHKCPQVVEFSRTMSTVGKNAKERPEGVIVASSSRLYYLRTNPALTLLIVPLIREIIHQRVNLYNAYFLLVEALVKAEKFYGTGKILIFYQFLSQVTYILRSLLRFALVDRAAKYAERMEVPFNIYGSEDWGSLFPKAYTARYLSLEELHRVYEKNVVLIPTPSTTFEVQHPSITKVLLLGGRVVAPMPLMSDSNGSAPSLNRFYFSAADEIEETISEVMESACITCEERDVLLDKFGVEGLCDVVQDVMGPNNSRGSMRIWGAEEAKNFMSAEDLRAVGAYSEYVVLLFEAIQGRCTCGDLFSKINDKGSAFFSQEVEECLLNKSRYITKLGYENDIQEKVLKNIFY